MSIFTYAAFLDLAVNRVDTVFDETDVEGLSTARKRDLYSRSTSYLTDVKLVTAIRPLGWVVYECFLVVFRENVSGVMKKSCRTTSEKRANRVL